MSAVQDRMFFEPKASAIRRANFTSADCVRLARYALWRAPQLEKELATAGTLAEFDRASRELDRLQRRLARARTALRNAAVDVGAVL